MVNQHEETFPRCSSCDSPVEPPSVLEVESLLSRGLLWGVHAQDRT